MIKLILAVDEKEWIWKNWDLAWSLKWDMNFFKDETTKWDKMNIVLMWRKTYESIPEKFRPLKNRCNVVISSQIEDSKHFDLSKKEWPYYFSNIEKWIFNSRLLCWKDLFNNTYIIWWEKIYDYVLKHSLDIIDEIILTRISWDYWCDKFVKWIFEIVENEFEEYFSSEEQVEIDENWKEHKFVFKKYKRKTN